VHPVVVTAANVADLTQAAQLLRGDETQVYSDAGCTGVEQRPEIVALAQPIDWRIARKRGPVKALAEGAPNEAIKAAGHAKAAVRAGVEHPFRSVKISFAAGRHGIADWRKPRTHSTRPSAWPTWCSPPAGPRRKPAGAETAPPARREIVAAAPVPLSLTAAARALLTPG
jgi:hypothetical protein